MRLSFLTLQRGNALGDAPRHRSAPRRLLESGRRASKWHTGIGMRVIVASAPLACSCRLSMSAPGICHSGVLSMPVLRGC
ncbi:DUF1534 domain-containing protein [Pseudomonas tremae]|nr:DUF1534 domain-containing protein [Pseudomonas tremae]MCF5810017.1 DUF1534 domain-containing protein [Pseudomonas tremae]